MAIINNKKRLVDVAKVEINNGIKYSMNMIGWGLVTDVGNKAENYRWLGTSRYTILSILEVLMHKSRSATLIMDEQKIEDDFTFIIACNSIHVGNGMKMAPKAKLDDGLIDLIVVRSNVSRRRLLATLPKLFDDGAGSNNHVQIDGPRCHAGRQIFGFLYVGTAREIFQPTLDHHRKTTALLCGLLSGQ